MTAPTSATPSCRKNALYSAFHSLGRRSSKLGITSWPTTVAPCGRTLTTTILRFGGAISMPIPVPIVSHLRTTSAVDRKVPAFFSSKLEPNELGARPVIVTSFLASRLWKPAQLDPDSLTVVRQNMIAGNRDLGANEGDCVAAQGVVYSRGQPETVAEEMQRGGRSRHIG